MTKELFAIPGYRLKCTNKGYLSPGYDNVVRLESSLWKDYDPLEWISKHQYVLKDIEKRIISKRI